MRKQLLSLINGIIAIGFFIYYMANIYEIAAKTYYVDEAKLYRIDTFHLFNRAYEKTKYVNNYSSKSYLEFKSTNGYSFSIADNVFSAIKNKQKLEDTLSYHDIKFTVFSNRKNYSYYRNHKEPLFVEVYQIQIGDTKYIDIPFLNKLLKGDRLLVVFYMPLTIIFFGVLLYKTRDNKQWTIKKANLFAVGCFFIFLIILIGVIIFS